MRNEIENFDERTLTHMENSILQFFIFKIQIYIFYIVLLDISLKRVYSYENTGQYYI